MFRVAAAGEESRSDRLDAGAHDYVIKPFSGRNLIARVTPNWRWRVFRQVRAEEALRESAEVLREQNQVLLQLAKAPGDPTIDLGEVLRRIIEAAARTLGVDRASVWHYDEDRTKIICLDLYEMSAGHHSRGLERYVAHYPSYFDALNRERIIAGGRYPGRSKNNRAIPIIPFISWRYLCVGRSDPTAGSVSGCRSSRTRWPRASLVPSRKEFCRIDRRPRRVGL